MEDTLDSFLFSAMQTGGDPEKKTGELKMKIERIRNDYAHYMWLLISCKTVVSM